MIIIAEILFDEFTFHSPARQLLLFFCVSVIINAAYSCFLMLKGIRFNLLALVAYMISGCFMCTLAYLFEKIVFLSNGGMLIQALIVLSLFLIGIIVCGVGYNRYRVKHPESCPLFTIKICSANSIHKLSNEGDKNNETVVLPEKQDNISYIAELISKFFKKTRDNKSLTDFSLCINATQSGLSNKSLVQAYELSLQEDHIPLGCSVELKNNEFNIVLSNNG